MTDPRGDDRPAANDRPAAIDRPVASDPSANDWPDWRRSRNWRRAREERWARQWHRDDWRANRPAWAGRRPPWAGGRPIRRQIGCFIAGIALVLGSIGVLMLWLLSNVLGFAGPEGTLANIARTAGLVVLVVGVIALALAARFLRGIGEPLGDIVEAAGRVEQGDYTARVSVSPRGGPRELRDLGRAFNTMAARLEADEAHRRSLLADVSHELRTPLAVIQGNVEALADGVYPADAEHLAPILDETRVMARLIDDLRTVALAESGRLPLHREATDLAILVGEVAASFRAVADEAGVRLETDVADDVPLLEVDPLRIREVLTNLVANAVRAVPRGGGVAIDVRLDPGGESGQAGFVAVEVRDDGPGIPPDLLPHVFDRFAKAPDSRGSGLGLAIVRGIVLAHDGDIRAESSPSGTTIRFLLPVGRA